MSKKRQMIEAINDFVVGCKSDNIWDSIKACCILSGWNNLDGCLTPIKGDAPTNYNFVANDYNLLTGLQGDGLTKYLDSNRAGNDDPLNNNHYAAYVSTLGTKGVLGVDISSTANTTISNAAVRNKNSSPHLYTAAVGLVATSRSSQTSFSLRNNGINTTVLIASDASETNNVWIMSVPPSSFVGNHRLAFYSIGEALDLELLDNRVSTLIKDLTKPYVTNVEAKNWIDRVYDNGGTVSQSTATAVDIFCNSIEEAGIRDRFYRLNLFAGDNLNAALVPLYTGPTYGGSTYGNSVDENNNFVSGDYNETGANGGLQGNGSSKYLDTGFSADILPDMAHIGFYKPNTNATPDSDRPIGAYDTSLSPAGIVGFRTNNTGDFTPEVRRIGAGGLIATTSGGLLVVDRDAEDSLTTYDDGVSAATNSFDATGHPMPEEAVFVFNQNLNGSPIGNGYYDETISSYTFGASMIATQHIAFAAAMDSFQTSLNRNV